MFTWVPIYQEAASKILEFESRQAELLQFIAILKDKGLPTIKLDDRSSRGSETKLLEIDPFSFFANFNRQVSDENRIKILGELKREWSLESPVPSDFAGIPIINNYQSWFFPYAQDRTEEDIPNLWSLARETVKATPQTFNKKLIEDCLSILSVALPKLTMGMFWLNPLDYLSVDRKNLTYIFEQIGRYLAEETADSYFQFLADVRASVDCDYPTLSHRAHLSAIGRQPEDETHEQRFWTLGAGHDGVHWPEFSEREIIAIGWDDFRRDLQKFTSKEAIREKMLELWPDGGNRQNDALACWQFAHEMKPGDIIFAKQGTRKLFACGRVTGDYVYDKERQTYRHIRKVKWLSKGPWELTGQLRMHQKTLTDVTSSSDLVTALLKTAGVDLKEFEPESPLPSKQYWWLNANPQIWDFSNLAVGETQTYTSYNERGNKRRIYKYFEQVKPGDVLIGYLTSPNREIIAVGKITRGLHETPDGPKIEFTKTEVLNNSIGWEELQGVTGLENCEPLVNNQGSLFALTEEEYEIIRAIIDEKNPTHEQEPVTSYTRADALSELFLTENEFDDILWRIRRKKNIILQGPPGVGKTFVAKRLAYAMMGMKDASRVEMVQFHQSYAYEDFIQGYRPQEQGGFSLKPGLFYKFCLKAQRDPQNDYFFIIDEINRGNMSKIFGELMMLLEHDKRGQEFAIQLTYSGGPDERFYIPENLYLIGTMNTADRSLSLVDYALRRRFTFADLQPKFESEKFAATLRKAGASSSLIRRIQERFTNLNEYISADSRNLGIGYCIGHSYFCPANSGISLNDDWYKEIIESEIRPLLEEYWIDEKNRVAEQITMLLT